MKKRIAVSLISVIILLAMILPCGAKLVPGWRVEYDYGKYLNHVNAKRNSKTLPEHFVYYGQIAVLGEFESLLVEHRRDYTYKVRDKTGIEISFATYPGTNREGILFYRHNDDSPVYSSTIGEAAIDDVVSLSHMIQLKPGNYEGDYVGITTGRLTYYYRSVESVHLLDGIYWDCDGHTHCLKMLWDYPADKDTLVGRFLNAETAEAALAELIAFMDANVDAEEKALAAAQRKKDIKDWIALNLPFAIGIGVGATLTISTAIALPIVIVRRKRRKKAALAGGGEDGMDDAGEDVDSANKSDSGGEETDSGGVKISGGENADISRDDTVPNPPTDPG